MTGITQPVELRPEQTVDMARYGKAAVRGWPVVAAFVMLGAAGGFVADGLQPLSYTGTSVVQVNEGAVYALDTATSTGPNMDTEAQVALSSTVITEAAKKVPGSLTVAQFQSQASATTPKKSSTLILTFTGASAVQAASGANALASAYLSHRTQQATGDIAQARKQVSSSSQTLGAQLERAQAEAVTAKAGTADAARLDDRVKLLNDQLNPVRAQLDRLNSVVINPGVQIGLATAPTRSNTLPAPIFVGVGAVVGLLIALIFLLAREALRDRVTSVEDLRRIAAVPVWAQTRVRDTAVTDDVISALAARLEVLRRHEPIRSLAVASIGSPVLGLCEQLAQHLTASGLPTTVLERLPATSDVHADRFVIIDAGVIVHDQSVAPTAALCDATLLVVNASDKGAQARRALADLAAAPAEVRGLIFDRRKRPQRSDDSSVGSRSSRSMAVGNLETDNRHNIKDDEPSLGSARR